jgi:cysteine sulfinate desulfinase/cysteine desulfurase-like protein
MAVAPELSAAAIRVSLGWDTGDEDVERFIAGWKEIYGKFAGRRHAA